jgi:RNA polymerase sigma factor (sigma-70 family)
MTTARSENLIRQIRRLAAPAQPGPSDAELLRRFAGQREEAAFAALVRRHGPMVLCVCRRVLGNADDAEDAFQAAFLTLARKAPALRSQDSVAGWVYRVAYRLALRARARAGRRQAADRAALQGRPQEEPAGADPLDAVTGRELSRVLDEELNRLPEKWRAPLVLCYLEGATRDEAAVQLGWPLGTLKHRLEKGRAALRGRLTRRGLALSAVLPGALLTGKAARAALPAALIDRTVRAGLAAGARGAAAALTVRVLLSGRARLAALVLLTLAVIGAGAGLLSHRPPAEADPPPRAGAEPRPRPAPPPAPPAEKSEKREELAISGRVLDPAGKPVAGAEITVVMVGWHDPGAEGKADDVNRSHEVKADEDGRFRAQVARPAGVLNPLVRVIAAAPGFGFGWSEAPGDSPATGLVIRLHAERTLRGRVLDVEGRPVAGARVQVERAVAPFVRPYFNPAPSQAPVPKPVTTDADGRFTLPGIGRDVAVRLDVLHEDFTPDSTDVATADQARPGDVAVVLSPARTLSGRVVAADTGKPVPGVRITFQAYSKDSNWAGGGVIVRTDEEGRFSARPYRGEVYPAYVTPPEGRPYLGVQRRVEWPRGVVKHEVTFELPPGVVVGGTVVDEGDGKPIAGAAVNYRAAAGNPNVKPGVAVGAPLRTGADGTFRITVLPGEGYLLVEGPAPDYVRRELYSPTGFGGLSEEAKGARLSPAGFARVTLKEGAKPDGVTIKLRRGVTVEGKLVGADGKPALRALMLSPLNVHPGSHQLAVSDHVEIRDGTFRLRGCDPEKTYTVLFFDSEKETGAAVELSAKKASRRPVTVRLAPCGSAAGRLTRRDGTPLKDFPQPPQYLPLEVIVTPGTPRNFMAEKPAVFADATPLNFLDPMRYNDRHTDDKGQITFPALIPGATYRITGGYDPKKGFRFKDFKVEAGRKLDLGDLKLDW